MKNFLLDIVNTNGTGQKSKVVTGIQPLARLVILVVLVLTLFAASAVSANALDYGTVNIDESKTLSTGAVCPAGPGESCLPITSVIIQGANASEFTIASENCSGATLSGGGGCSISITFTPQNPPGPKTAAVVVLGSSGPFFSVELIGIAAASTKRFTPEQRQTLREIARELRAFAHAAGQASKCPFPICSAVGKIGGAISGAAFALKKLGEDPPDPNYTSIFEPEIPTPLPFTTAAGLSPAEVEAFNDLLTSQAQVIAYAEAILISNNRADGALAASDAFWENKQLEASAKYALKLASLLNEQTVLWANLRNVLEVGGFPTIALTLEEVVAFQNLVAANGLPDDFIEILTQLGATSKDIEDIRMSLVTDDPPTLIGNFPEMLTTRESLFDALQRAAAALIEFALEHLPEDTQPPVIMSLAVDKPVLWPPNHKLVDVFVSYNVEDNIHVHDITINISSNERGNGIGDGNTTSDWEILDNHHVRLRAERGGGGFGRIYTITITATDFFGNSSTKAVTVTVPATH